PLKPHAQPGMGWPLNLSVFGARRRVSSGSYRLNQQMRQAEPLEKSAALYQKDQSTTTEDVL
ncbi:MAG: hypothetical protein RSD81_05415, partial [Pseudomonas sp.]